MDRTGIAITLLATGAMTGVPIGVFLAGKGDLSAWLGFWGGAAGAIITVIGAQVVESGRRRAEEQRRRREVAVHAQVLLGYMSPLIATMAECANLSSYIDDGRSLNGDVAAAAARARAAGTRLDQIVQGYAQYLPDIIWHGIIARDSLNNIARAIDLHENHAAVLARKFIVGTQKSARDGMAALNSICDICKSHF